MSTDHTSEKAKMLLGMGLQLLFEARFQELRGRLPAVPGLGGVDGASAPGALVFSETRYVFEYHPHRVEIAEYLIERGLLERAREEEYDHHVRLTEWGRTFAVGCVNNIVMTR